MIDVTVSDGELRELASGLAGEIDLTEAMREGVRHMQARAIARIRRESTDADGGSFAGLSEKYRRRKARTVGVRPILVAQGKLIRSLSSGRDRIMEVGPNGFKYGSRVAYAGFHVDGTGKMPARDFLSFSDADLREMELIVLGEVLRQAGI